MTEKKVFIHDDNRAEILCPKCGTVNVLDISSYKGIDSASRIKSECTCGFVSSVLLERRKFYRKETNLSGLYIFGVEEEQPMTVKDLSLIGLKFRTEAEISFKVGDAIFVEFQMDKEETRVRKKAVVKSISDELIGAEFCSTDPESPSDEAIRFYVIP